MQVEWIIRSIYRIGEFRFRILSDILVVKLAKGAVHTNERPFHSRGTDIVSSVFQLHLKALSA